jgi:hypothetical protein
MNDAGNTQKTTAVAIPAATGGRLVGVGGLFNNHEWLVQKTPFTFGRLNTSDVNLDHEVGASRTHAEIRSEGPYYTIVDRSSNGTVVNGTRIQKGVVQPLRHNDVITICNTSFKFKHELSAGASPSNEEEPEPTGIFNVNAIVSGATSTPAPAPPAPPHGPKGDDAVFSLDAMDMMARAARAEAEAAEAKARADREVARLRAEAEAARQESRRFRLSVEEAAEARARVEAEAKAMLEAEMARQQAALDIARQKVEAEVRARAETELARLRAEAEAAKQLAEAEVRARAEVELARLRAEAEASRQLAEAEEAKARAESRRFNDAEARALAEAKARAEAEARANAEAKARVEAETRAASEHQELERLRAESRRFSTSTPPAATPSTAPLSTTTALPLQPDPFAAVVARNANVPAPPSMTSATPAPPAMTPAPPATTTPPSTSPSTPASTPPSNGPASATTSMPRTSTRLVAGSMRTTPPSAAYRFGLGDNVILVLSADNLRGETICTSARLVGIAENGELTIDCVDPVSATRWDQKTVMVGKNPHNGSLLVAETRILAIDDSDYNTVRLSTTSGRLTSVQLRSSVRQRAIPEVQTFTRFDGGVARLVDYSIGGVGLAVSRGDLRKRGDAIAGTLQLKRSLVFEVTLEVRGRERMIDSPDEDLLNCRFSTREMDPETLRKISMAVLYRR